MTGILHLSKNYKGHDYVIGDLHGCIDDLQECLSLISFDTQHDRLFSVGDLIDRGPNSLDALELLNAPWFYSVRGNHEELMIQSILHNDAHAKSTWLLHGGEWSSSLHSDLLQTWATRLAQLPYAIAVGEGEDRFNVIHAEFFGTNEMLDAGQWPEHVKKQLVWGRNLLKGNFAPNCQQGLSKTYCGHTIVESIKTIEKQIFLDMGAYIRNSSNVSSNFLSLINANTFNISGLSPLL